MIAHHAGLNRRGFVAGIKQKRLLAGLPLDHRRRQFGRRVQAHGQDGPLQALQGKAAGRIIGVDHRNPVRLQVLEQPRFDAAIIEHRAVIVQVISAEIRQHRHVELDTGNTPFGQSAAGHFHDRSAAVMVRHLRQLGGEFSSRGRRAWGRHAIETIAVCDRADQSVPLSRRGKDGIQQPRRGGLAIGSRDAHGPHPSAGVACQMLAQPAKGIAAVRHHADGYVHRVKPIGQNGFGAASQSFFDRRRAIGASGLHRRVQIARAAPPRIVTTRRNTDIRAAYDTAMGKEFAQTDTRSTCASMHVPGLLASHAMRVVGIATKPDPADFPSVTFRRHASTQGLGLGGNGHQRIGADCRELRRWCQEDFGSECGARVERSAGAAQPRRQTDLADFPSCRNTTGPVAAT